MEAQAPATLTGRIHHTARKSIRVLGKIPQRGPEMKPRGLWYAMGSAWWDWCHGEEFRDLTKVRSYRLDIDTTHFAMLKTERDVREFTKRFSVPAYPGARLNQIDWSAVATQFKGLEVDPYLYTLRFQSGFLWYYGLDVPGGCLWDYSALRGTEKVFDPYKT